MYGRPLRLEHPGAVGHITSRGNNRSDIYLGDEDHLMFLDIFAEVTGRDELGADAVDARSLTCGEFESPLAAGWRCDPPFFRPPLLPTLLTRDP